MSLCDFVGQKTGTSAQAHVTKLEGEGVSEGEG